MLAAGNFPQHRTVCEFRRRHLAEFSELFVGVVQVAREMGLARFGKLSVAEGASGARKAMSYERMGKEAARLPEIEALLTTAGMVDAEEDERWGEDFRGGPRSCNAGRSASRSRQPKRVWRRRNAGATMSAGASRGRTAIPGAGGLTSGPASPSRRRRAITDPESQIMKTSSEGFQQCYNAQMAVDGEHQIIDSGGATGQRPGSAGGDAREINETFGVGLRWYWPMRATATSRICWSSRHRRGSAGA